MKLAARIPFAVLPLLAAAVLAGCTPAAPLPETDPRAGDPAPTKERIDVGGYKLTLLTQGTGRPTVVIEPGAGGAGAGSDEWAAVAAEVAKTCRVVRYDRAGLGTSDAPPKKPRTSQDVAQDLHTLLANAKIPGPYVLVGHSVGGLHVRVFADLYPDAVAGVVLSDSAHPDQDAKWLAVFGPEAAGEEPAVAKGRLFLAGRLKDRGKNPEGIDMVATWEQVRAARSLGAKPLAVLTHSPKWKMVPDLPDDVMGKIEGVSQTLQAEFKGLSTDSTHTVAEKAGHGIHVDEPELVVAAIREVVGKVQGKEK